MKNGSDLLLNINFHYIVFDAHMKCDAGQTCSPHVGPKTVQDFYHFPNELFSGIQILFNEL